MRIIPAIDIIDGKCVRLTQGDYAQKKVYNENPVEIALNFEKADLQFLHLVDLDGAKAGTVVNWNVVRDITSQTRLSVDFGGGIKKTEEIQKLLDLGIKQVNLGSIAVRQPDLVYGWIQKFGADKIILSADVKAEKIQISGWQENAAMTIQQLVQAFSKQGLQYATCTDIDTDGMLKGPNIILYRKLLQQFPSIKWVASGGVSSIEDVRTLKAEGVDGVIIGKAIYENKISLNELRTISNGAE